MSRPEIALHKKNVMSKQEKTPYKKRTQKDYSLTFKLEVVSNIERGLMSVTGAQRRYGIQGRSTVTNWLRKYGNFDWENQTPSNMPKSKDQRILELEQANALRIVTEYYIENNPDIKTLINHLCEI